ncbi:MAG: amylo-alpha-1,6-glucosidase, partial [bacterium]|nr:amylo-alpha-1,6-glucosidase [bacterium]
MLVLTGQDCKDLEIALKKEWLEGNRLNAYSYGNLYLQNNKNEHGLLVIPRQGTKLTVVSSLIEKFTVGDKTCYTNFYRTSEKQAFLDKFSIDYGPHFIYHFYSLRLERSLLLLQEKNAVVIRYRGLEQETDVPFVIQPLLSLKEYNALKKTEEKKFEVVKEENYIKYSDETGINLFFYFKDCEFTPCREYLPYGDENYLIPGSFAFTLKKENDVFLIVAAERLKDVEVDEAFDREMKSRQNILKDLNIKNELYKNMTLSSSFYLSRVRNQYEIKESLIHPKTSFQVLLNSTSLLFSLKKPDVIKEILIFLSRNIKKGLVPDRIDPSTGAFQYDSIDNSFWYLLFLYDFIEYTGDWKFIKDFLWENLRSVFYEYTNTILHTRLDSDGLLINTEKLNTGKMIEYEKGKNLSLNILWYNAVRILEMLGAKFADIDLHSKADEAGSQIRKNLYLKFWNKSGNYLNTVIDVPPMNETDDSFRPHQILALSLPFDDLLHVKTKSYILDRVKEKLLTPFGLRTLSVDSPSYIRS